MITAVYDDRFSAILSNWINPIGKIHPVFLKGSDPVGSEPIFLRELDPDPTNLIPHLCLRLFFYVRRRIDVLLDDSSM